MDRLGEKSYAGGLYTEFLWSNELRILWLQRSSCLGRWVVTLTLSSIDNKEITYSICVSYIMV